MLRHINDFSDDENLKVNIIMKDGVEFLGVDLVNGTSAYMVGFAWDVGVRMVNREDIRYLDWYSEEEDE